MVRKTKEDTQATREGILDAAEACFHEHGVARTTLEMIGARAGYTRGAVYWHFKNKSEVLAAIVERVHLPFMQELERTSTDQRDTPVHDLRAVMISTRSSNCPRTSACARPWRSCCAVMPRPTPGY